MPSDCAAKKKMIWNGTWNGSIIPLLTAAKRNLVNSFVMLYLFAKSAHCSIAECVSAAFKLTLFLGGGYYSRA